MIVPDDLFYVDHVHTGPELSTFLVYFSDKEMTLLCITAYIGVEWEG